jgi:SIR2-like domain
MANPETLAEKFERLATRIVAGDAVFFIGAGYSLDSEGNSAGVLIARLLARFEALTETMRTFTPGAAKLANVLRDGFEATFSLGWDTKESFLAAPGAKKLKTAFDVLQQSYFLINDWMCSAFESIIACLAEEKISPVVARKISKRENALLDRYRAIDLFRNSWRLAPLDFDRYIQLYNHAQNRLPGRTERATAGKALFLDTMGFPSAEVMAGSPMVFDLSEVLTSYGSRLRTRHHTLAWLALEGVLPVLITTNYDQLLEGAYRLAGLLPLNPPEEHWPKDKPPARERAQAIRLPLNRRFRYFSRIADATQFFSRGETQQAALILKIHGCVDSYRIARGTDRNGAEKHIVLTEQRSDQWRAVLPSMVFTYREIQNWREDSWSQDYLRTMLRTRTVIFAGYSGQDPVIHDTFRSVYEEMAGYRSARRKEGEDENTHKQSFPEAQTEPRAPEASARAQAFFLEGRPNFYGLEILRAASMAAGERQPELTRHPNLLSFLFENKPGFPHVDEMMAWTFHLVYRQLQSQALESDLARIAYQLLGHPAPEREAKRIRQNFEQLLASERATGQSWKPDSAEQARPEFERMSGWTLRFHYALLRQYATAENLMRYPGDGFQIGAIVRFPWYCPASEHPDWAAWAVIVELAIRRIYAAAGGDLAGWTTMSQKLEPVSWTCPALLLGESTSIPRKCLSIELVALRKMWGEAGMPRSLRMRRPVIWRLRNETVPWWQENDEARPENTPSANSLWNWAASREGNLPPPGTVEAHTALGGKDV